MSERIVIRGDREAFRPYAPAEVFDRIVELKSITELTERFPAYGDALAVQYNGTDHTYNELYADIAHYRAVLAENGVQAGDRVILHRPNSYGLLVNFLAAATLGASAAIAPAQLPAQAIAGLSQLFRCKLAIGSEEDKAICPVTTLTGDETTEASLPSVEVEASAEAAILFTGGTTGKSKGAVLSNGALMQGTINSCYGMAEVFGERQILALPMSHVFGLVFVVLNTLYTGSAVCICVTSRTLFSDAATFRPTKLVAVPALAEMALSLSKKFGKPMLGPDMRMIICGAAAIPPYLVGEYKKIGITMLGGYGLTESSNLVAGNPELLKEPNAVGFPYPNQELCIAENGELLLRGKNMLTAYIGTPEKAYDEDGWFHTGDLVRYENGYLSIVGRIKEILVLPNGENVSPAEVEAKFNELACVQDSQLF